MDLPERPPIIFVGGMSHSSCAQQFKFLVAATPAKAHFDLSKWEAPDNTYRIFEKIIWQDFNATEWTDPASLDPRYVVDSRILSAPLPILQLADIIVVVYPPTYEIAFEAAVLAKKEGPQFQDVIWPSFVENAKHFMESIPSLKNTTIIFIEETAEIRMEGIRNLDISPERLKLLKGLGSLQGFRRCAVLNPQNSCKAAAVRNIREHSKSAFRGVATSQCEALLDGLPKNRQACLDFVTRTVLRLDVTSAIRSREEIKTFATEIIRTTKNEHNLARLYTENALSHFKSLNPEEYECRKTDRWSIFDLEEEGHFPDYFTQSLKEMVNYCRTIIELCNILFVIHHHFCFENPSIFHLTVLLLKSRNPIFIWIGFNMLGGILNMQGEEQFSKHFADMESELPAPVSTAIFEAMAFLLKPGTDFSDSRLEELSSYSFHSGYRLLKAFPSHHPAQIEDHHVVDILESLPRIYQSFRGGPEAYFATSLLIHVIEPLCPVIRFGKSKTIQKIMPYVSTIFKIVFTAVAYDIQIGTKEIFENKKFPAGITNGMETCNLLLSTFPYYQIEPLKAASLGKVEQDVRQGDPVKHKAPSELDILRGFLQVMEQKLAQLEAEYTELKVVVVEKEKIERENALIKENHEHIVAELMAKLERKRLKILHLEALSKQGHQPTTLLVKEESSQPEPGRIPVVPKIVKSEETTKTSIEIAKDYDTRIGDLTVADLKQFVKIIANERDTMPASLRPSICGMLKHLGEDLYTSKAHFIQEMFQNADDNEFASADCKMAVFIGKDSITIGNNEIGMKPSDVLSLCSAATSYKRAGIHTGQKGLGFKAIFAVTVKPIIISKDWSFFFHSDKTLPGIDELGYITPTWIEKEDYPSDLTEIVKCEQFTTLIYLPLKKEISLVELERGFQRTLNPLSLLCAHKLNLLSLHQNGLREDVCVQNELSNTLSTALDLPTNFTEAKKTRFWEAKLVLSGDQEKNVLIQLPWDKENSLKFIIFEAKLNFVNDINFASQRRIQSKEPTTLRIIFPHPTLAQSHDQWPVCATLPVCYVGIPFILQADWDVVTSRENLVNNQWNHQLLLCFLSLFEVAIESHQILRSSLESYLFSVKVDGEMGYFWKNFEKEIKKRITSQLPQNLFLPNPQIDSFLGISDSMFDSVNIKIARGAQAEFSTKLLEGCLPTLSMREILRCFEDGKNRAFCDWTRAQSPDWWSRFYDLIHSQLASFKKDTSSKRQSQLIDFIQTVKNQPIFLPNPNTENRRILLNPNASVYVCATSSEREHFQTWRRNLIFIASESTVELDVLFLLFKKIDIGQILQEIILSHPNSSNEELWWDLEFLSRHPRHVEDSFELLKTKLYVPTSETVRLIHKTTLATVLGVNVVNATRLNALHGGASPVLVRSDQWSLATITRVERFLVQMGASLPEDTDPIPQLLPIHELLSKEDVESAIRSLETLPKHLLDFLSSCLLPAKNGGPPLPARGSCASFLRSAEYLPSVYVPEQPTFIKYAKLLGINVKPSLDTTMRVLQHLVHMRCTDLQIFISWLAFASVEATKSPKAIEWIQRIKEEPFLGVYVDMDGDTTEFRYLSADSIYCLDEPDESIELVARLLGYAVVHFQNANKSLIGFTKLLRALGCRSNPSISDIVSALFVLKSKSSTFLIEGKSDTVTPKAFNQLLATYQLLEGQLLTAPQDERPKLLKESLHEASRLSDDADRLPLLLSNFKFNRGSPLQGLLQTPVEWFGKGISDQRLSFVHYKVCRIAPTLLEMLHVPHFRDLGILEMGIASTDNLPNKYFKLSADLAKEFNNPDLEVLQVIYWSITIAWLPGHQLRTYNSKEYIVKDTGTLISIEDPAIVRVIDLKLVSNWAVLGPRVFFTATHSPAATPIVLRGVFEHLSMLYNKNTEDEAMKHSTEFFKEYHLATGRKDTVIWEPSGDKRRLRVNFEDVHFPVFNHFVDEGEPQAMQHNRRAPQARHRWNKPDLDLVCSTFEQRIALANDKPTCINPHTSPKTQPSHGPIVVDNAAIVESGLMAEVFAYHYFKSKFSQTFSAGNWVSSNREKLFPNMSPPVDDSLGYDFSLKDTCGLFSAGQLTTGNPKQCWIEVKGCAGPWDNRFMVSRNEYLTRKQCTNSKQGSYYILFFVEFTADAEKTRVYGFYNWTLNNNITLTPEQCLGEFSSQAGIQNFPTEVLPQQQTEQHKQPISHYVDGGGTTYYNRNRGDGGYGCRGGSGQGRGNIYGSQSHARGGQDRSFHERGRGSRGTPGKRK